MELKKTCFERLIEISLKQCMPLGTTPAQSMYSAIRQNKGELEKLGMKFKIVTEKVTEAKFICRVK